MDTFWAIIPPVAAIVGAAATKRIIPSLLLGLLAISGFAKTAENLTSNRKRGLA